MCALLSMGVDQNLSIGPAINNPYFQADWVENPWKDSCTAPYLATLTP